MAMLKRIIGLEAQKSVSRENRPGGGGGGSAAARNNGSAK